MKKFLSMVLALIMVLSLFTVGAGAAFEDADEIQYTTAVDVMTKLGILSGYDNNYFSPNGTISRGAAAKILAYIALGTKKAEALTCVEAPFSDVAVTSSVAPFIAWVAKEDIVTGYDNGTFAPKAPVSGHAYLKMVLGAMGIEGQYEGDGWRLNVTNNAAEAGLFEGVDTTAYDLRDSMTRELACQIAFNAMFYSKTATKTQYIVWVDKVVAGATAEKYDAGKDTLIYKGTDAMAAAVAQLGTTNAQMIQDTVAADSLGYKNFGLKKTENGTTTYKRPSVNYSSDIASYAETLKTVSAVKTPVLTFANGATAKEIWTALGYTKEADTITMNVYEDGVAVTPAKTYTKGDAALYIGGKGATVEVYKTETSKTFDVIVINTYAKKLVKEDIVAAKAATETKDAVAAYIKVEGNPSKPTATGAFKTAAFAKDDVILYTKDNGAIKTVTKATTVAGVKIQKYVDTANKESVTVNGVVLPVAAKVLSGNTKTGYSFSKAYNLFLDAQGNVAGYELVAADVIKNYVYVSSIQAAKAAAGDNLLTAAAENAAVADVIFTDGTHKVIDLKIAATTTDGVTSYTYGKPAVGGTVTAKAALETIGKTPIQNWFAYTLNADGTYTLSQIDAEYAKVADAAATITLTKGAPATIGGKITNSKTTLTTIATTTYGVKTATGLVAATLANPEVSSVKTNKVLITYTSSTATTIAAIYAVEQDAAALDTTSVSAEYVYALTKGASVNDGTEWTFAVAGGTVTYTVKGNDAKSDDFAGKVYTLTFDTKGIATAAPVGTYAQSSEGTNAYAESWTVKVIDETFLTRADGSVVYLAKDIAVTNVEDAEDVTADELGAKDVATIVIKKVEGKFTILAAFITDAN